MTSKLLQALFLALFLMASHAATAQDSLAFRVVGFRSAHFGMSLEQVREAARKDFNPAEGATTEIDNQAEQTWIYLVKVPVLEPGPGPALVSYVFRPGTHHLSQINITWSTGPKPSGVERTAISEAGMMLADYFRAKQWLPEKTASGMPTANHGISLFVGVDPASGAIELHANGVAVARDSAVDSYPTGPAELLLSYIDHVGTK